MSNVDETTATPARSVPRARGIFANRTLNLRSVRAVGYDMDYTLVHYYVDAWERRAYEHLKRGLVDRGWPVDALEFDPELVIRGLVVDTQAGNVLKANRFGFVKRAYHGTRPLDFEGQRAAYARTIVDLSESRWAFLNTLFSISEACMFMHLVDLLDARRLPEVLGYGDLWRIVRSILDRAHMEGQLKEEIVAAPDTFVEADPDTVLALLDQKHAGKKLMLITNSEWSYTKAMMSHGFDRHLGGKGWRSLFDVVIVAAGKPDFFSSKAPLFEIVNEDGLLKPCLGTLETGKCYWGGNASLVERHLGLSGDEILYAGDHIYGDVRVSKTLLRWRTALIVRELEDEITALEGSMTDDAWLGERMADKEGLEHRLCELRLAAQRQRLGYGPAADHGGEDLAGEIAQLRDAISALDDRIAPRARAAAQLENRHWGLLLRAGNDKSHLARQIERSADVYTSRVSNFLFATPFAFLRAPRGSLPHDPRPAGFRDPPGNGG